MATRHADERARTSRAFRAYVDLIDTAEWLRERMSRQLETFDMTMMEFRVLETLHNKGPQYQQALSRKFRCSKQNVAHVLKRLEDEGWVWRGPGMLRTEAQEEAAAGDAEADADAADSGEEDARPVPGRWIEKMKTYWERFRPSMYEALESSGRLHKAAVMAVVEMRPHLDAAAKKGERIERALEAGRGQFWFLQREKDEEKRRQEAAQRAADEKIPPDMVPRIIEHWRRFLPDTYAELAESGGLEEAARKQALRAQDAFLKMRSRIYNEEEAWEAARKSYPFMPDGEENGKGKSENGGPEGLAEDRNSKLENSEGFAADFADDANAEAENGNQKSENGNGQPEEWNSEVEYRNSEELPVQTQPENALTSGAQRTQRNTQVADGPSTLMASRPSSVMAGRPSLLTAGRPVVVIHLTAKGEALIANVFGKHAKVVKAQMRVLEGREQQSLSKLCGKLRRGDMARFIQELMMEDPEEEE
jgi:DNA-binding MarR family transcriptional regulator